MNKEFLAKIFSALRGGNVYADRESFRIELAEAIMASLKEDDFIVKANRLVIGCADARYEEAIEESRTVILNSLMNQGGSMRTLAERLFRKKDSLCVVIGPPPENKTVIEIPKERLQAEIWFALETVKENPSMLVLKRTDWSATLDPSKCYTIGRAEDPRDMSVMLTVPDASNSISRWQAELRCIDGEWHCKSVSDKCPTFIDGRYAQADTNFPLRNIQNGGQIKFGTGSPGFVLMYGVF